MISGVTVRNKVWLPRRTAMERESLSLTASITSAVVVTGCPFMLTITSWSLKPELGRGEKDCDCRRSLPHRGCSGPLLGHC